AALQEPEVARAQERSVAVFETRAEGLLRELRLIPVALGDARAAEPDLADLSLAAPAPRVGIGDGDARVEQRRPATDEMSGRPFLHAHGPVLLEARAAERHRPLMKRADGKERVLRQSIARIHALQADAAGGKGLAELAQRVRAHRLRAIEGDAPAREVERLSLLLADPFDAELVAEVGRAAERPAVAADG